MHPNPQPNPDSFNKTFETPESTLICGDFRQVLADMSAEVDLFLTSPPYNIGSKSERKDGQRSRGRYDAKSFGAVRSYPDSFPEAEYQKSQTEMLRWMASKLRPSGSIVYNHKLRHKEGKLLVPSQWFPTDALSPVDEIIWDRGSTHNHCLSFVYQHTERLYVLTRNGCERKRTYNHEGLSDVWRINRERVDGSKHDARFPLELARRSIRLWSNPGDLICDPYTGSGTTMVAAYLEGRRFIGAELMEEHFNEAQARFQRAHLRLVV